MSFKKVENNSFRTRDQELYHQWQFCDRIINDNNCSNEAKVMALVTANDIFKKRYELHDEFIRDYWKNR